MKPAAPVNRVLAHLKVVTMSYEYNFYLVEIMGELEIEEQYQGVPSLDLQRIIDEIRAIKNKNKSRGREDDKKVS